MMAKWENMFSSAEIFYFVIVIISVVNFGGVADDDVDGQRGINDLQPFRLNKLNVMWAKATKALDESILPALYAEFVLHDRREIDFKKRKRDGADPDGEEEAEIRHKFLDILNRFELRSQYAGETIERSTDSSDQLGDDDIVLKMALSSDPKLAKLWKKAEQAGFTNDELAVLKAEFGHHAEKLEEYEQMRTEMNLLEELDNSLEKFQQETDNSVNEKVNVREKHAAMKQMYKDLKQSYNSLRDATEQKLQQPQQLTLVDHRVKELWAMAQQANMTADELSSFKTELEHFERRISKHEFFEKQAEMSRATLQMKKKFEEHELPESHVKLESKAKDLGAKVKKWYSQLKSKILGSSAHADEL